MTEAFLEYVDGVNIFPKLPVYMRKHTEAYLRRSQMKQALCSMESVVAQLRTFNSVTQFTQRDGKARDDGAVKDHDDIAIEEVDCSGHTALDSDSIANHQDHTVGIRRKNGAPIEEQVVNEDPNGLVEAVSGDNNTKQSHPGIPCTGIDVLSHRGQQEVRKNVPSMPIPVLPRKVRCNDGQKQAARRPSTGPTVVAGVSMITLTANKHQRKRGRTKDKATRRKRRCQRCVAHHRGDDEARECDGGHSKDKCEHFNSDGTPK